MRYFINKYKIFVEFAQLLQRLRYVGEILNKLSRKSNDEID